VTKKKRLKEDRRGEFLLRTDFSKDQESNTSRGREGKDRVDERWGVSYNEKRSHHSHNSANSLNGNEMEKTSYETRGDIGIWVKHQGVLDKKVGTSTEDKRTNTLGKRSSIVGTSIPVNVE